MKAWVFVLLIGMSTIGRAEKTEAGIALEEAGNDPEKLVRVADKFPKTPAAWMALEKAGQLYRNNQEVHLASMAYRRMFAEMGEEVENNPVLWYRAAEAHKLANNRTAQLDVRERLKKWDKEIEVDGKPLTIARMQEQLDERRTWDGFEKRKIEPIELSEKFKTWMEFKLQSKDPARVKEIFELAKENPQVYAQLSKIFNGRSGTDGSKPMGGSSAWKSLLSDEMRDKLWLGYWVENRMCYEVPGVKRVSVSSDGRRIAVARHGDVPSIEWLELAKDADRKKNEIPGMTMASVESTVFSPDLKSAVSISKSKEEVIFRREGKEPFVLRNPQEKTQGVIQKALRLEPAKVSPIKQVLLVDAATVILRLEDGTVWRWSMNDPNRYVRIPFIKGRYVQDLKAIPGSSAFVIETRDAEGRNPNMSMWTDNDILGPQSIASSMQRGDRVASFEPQLKHMLLRNQKKLTLAKLDGTKVWEIENQEKTMTDLKDAKTAAEGTLVGVSTENRFSLYNTETQKKIFDLPFYYEHFELADNGSKLVFYNTSASKKPEICVTTLPPLEALTKPHLAHKAPEGENH